MVIYEGAAAPPLAELEGATPLQIARCAHAAGAAARGVTGMLTWPVDEPLSGTAQALGWLLGIVPDEARALQRGPVEAMGVANPPSSWTYAYTGNFSTVDNNVLVDPRVSLSHDETVVLIAALANRMGDGIHLAALDASRVAVMLDQPPRNGDGGIFPATGTKVPAPKKADGAIMCRAAETLAAHPINDVRVDLGENPASMLWLWGGGARPTISRPFLGAPLRGVMVSQSPLARGMAALCGMAHANLGELWTDTHHPALIEPDTLASLVSNYELIVVYVEAPQDGGRHGSAVDTVRHLDRLDVHVLARVMDVLARSGAHRLLVTALPEEGVGIAETPVLLTGERITPDTTRRWDEEICGTGSLGKLSANRCLTRLIGD